MASKETPLCSLRVGQQGGITRADINLQQGTVNAYAAANGGNICVERIGSNHFEIGSWPWPNGYQVRGTKLKLAYHDFCKEDFAPIPASTTAPPHNGRWSSLAARWRRVVGRK